MRTRIFCLLLIAVLLLPLFAGCQKREIDATYQIVYAEDDLYAPFGAKELSNAFKTVMGESLTVLSASRFDPETADKAIFVGDTGCVEKMPDMEGKDFEVAVVSEGVVICAKDPMTLFLTCKAISNSLKENEDGLWGEGNPVFTKSVCKKLCELSVGTDTMFSVMTQNVRQGNDGAGKNIADRKVRLKQLIEDYSPDLLGAQEVTKEWLEILRSYFGSEYGIVGCSRDGETAETGEWTPILYKKDRFQLLDSGTFWLTDTPNEVSKINGIKYNRICTWALLLDKVTDTEVLYCNTHLDHQSDEARSQQAKYLLNFLKKYEGQYPIFLTGDFNATTGTTPYRSITAVLSDAHRKAAADASEVKGTFHDYLTPKQEIDFCFYDEQMADALAYRIQSDDYKGYVSDHYGVIAYFKYK